MLLPLLFRADTLVVFQPQHFATELPSFVHKRALLATWGIETVKNRITARAVAVRNSYRCSMERNQSGKYCVRIQVRFPRHAWSLEVFFLASSFNRAMTKLEESLDFLQRNEEKLWFWGVDRAEDMGFSAEFLREAGLKLDRRSEFPRKATNLTVEPELEVPAFALGPMRRGLAESVEPPRVQAAGD
ncbi:MAG: hypothetical protein QOJ41_1787 [Acidobacteriaceae bacterium]|nr:hypothetical protein [Acidobacteriaceae bacterium]